MRNIIIILIIFIIFIECLNYLKNIEKFSNPKSKKSIAVVGNGPISEDDLNKINNYDIVCRFNDCKNYRKNDKITHLVVRQRYNTEIITGLDKNYKQSKPITDLIIIGTNRKLLEKVKNINSNLNCKIIEIYESSLCELKDYVCNLDKNTPFYFNKKNIGNKFGVYGPSSGFVLLSNIYNGDEIHIYGMNWNFTSGHNGNFEKNIIENHCKNCIIHKTNGNEYI